MIAVCLPRLLRDGSSGVFGYAGVWNQGRGLGSPDYRPRRDRRIGDCDCACTTHIHEVTKEPKKL